MMCEMTIRDGSAPHGRRGQMAVELAVLVPVVVVVALVSLNLMEFLVLCSRFDRASLDAVVSQGVAPDGNQTQVTATEAVRSALAEAMGTSPCEVDVRAEGVGDGGHETSFAISPLLTRYVCTMSFTPWPREVRMPGISLGSPVSLRHQRELVVDRYRPGVVL